MDCKLKCSSCAENICMECTDECDLCCAIICDKCTCEVNTCKCCKKDLGVDASIICTSCMVIHWLASSNNKGITCSACKTFCNCNTCNVANIIAEQKECPICLDAFANGTVVFQQCGIHMVCAECNYDTHRGCPICREGK